MKITIQNIKDITFGTETIKEENDYIVFSRFTESEKKVYADLPDLKIKTLATSGVRLDFYTDADNVSFDYKMIRASSRNLAFFDVYIDDVFVESVAHNDIDFEFTDKFSKSLKKGRKRITIFFSNLFNMQIKNFELSNGTYIEPYRYKIQILSYGDSITQGYDALFPSYSYINRFSMYLDAFIYNKAIGGDIFRPALIERKNFKPDIVTIAYGTNDWSKCTKADFISNMSLFIEKITKEYTDTKIIVITPIWRKDFEKIVQFGKFDEMVKLIKNECKKYEDIKVITGEELLPHTDLLFSDGYLHPNDIGMEIYSSNLYKKVYEML